MKIKMLVTFQGRETEDRQWPAGSVQEVDDGLAAWLIGHKKAERAGVLAKITETPAPAVAPVVTSKITKKAGGRK